MVTVGKRITSLFLFGLATVGAATQAAAQSAPSEPADNQDNQSVRTRSQPEYDAVGLPVGTFRFYPRIGATAEYNDNVFADTSNGVDDMAYTLTAGARLASDWTQHFLALEGSVQDTTYGDSEEDVDPAWSIGAEGRLDVQRDMRFTGSATYSDTFEPRGTNDVTGLVAPIHYDELRGNIGVEKEFNQLRLRLSSSYSTQDYDDGVLIGNIPFDQDFRDRQMTDVTGRVDYAISPDTAIWASYSQRWFDYDIGVRDFERQRALVGAAFDMTNLLRGEIGVGYTWGQYDFNTGVEDPDGFVASGSIDWFVTRLTTINFAVERDLGDSGDPQAPSKLLTDAGVRVDHELFRNVIVWGRAGWAREDYNGAPPYDRVDDVTSGSLGCDWLVNRYAAVQARFTHSERESEGLSASRDYEQNRFMIGVTLRR